MRFLLRPTAMATLLLGALAIAPFPTAWAQSKRSSEFRAAKTQMRQIAVRYARTELKGPQIRVVFFVTNDSSRALGYGPIPWLQYEHAGVWHSRVLEVCGNGLETRLLAPGSEVEVAVDVPSHLLNRELRVGIVNDAFTSLVAWSPVFRVRAP